MEDFAGKGHSCPFTLPETKSSTLKIDPLEKKIPIGNPSFLGAMLVLRSVSWHFITSQRPTHYKQHPPPRRFSPKNPRYKLYNTSAEIQLNDADAVQRTHEA